MQFQRKFHSNLKRIALIFKKILLNFKEDSMQLKKNLTQSIREKYHPIFKRISYTYIQSQVTNNEAKMGHKLVTSG